MSAVEHVNKLERLGPAAQFLAQKRQQLGPLWLNVGCGTSATKGWLNSDVLALADATDATREGEVYRVNGAIIYMPHDALQPYPLEDGSVQFVYSEHLIEHLSLDDAASWLSEMRRVLVDEGLVRISTPDLEQFARGYLDENQELFKEWHKDFLARANDPDMPQRPAYLFNIQMRRWGHNWLYDFPELSRVLREAGFRRIVKRAFREGQNPGARLDQEWRRVGSLYVEAGR